MQFMSQLDREFDSFLEGCRIHGQRIGVRTALQDDTMKLAHAVEGKVRESEKITVSQRKSPDKMAE
jgi:hypothetical protein